MSKQNDNVKITHVKTYPIAVPIHDFADAHESISTSNSVVVIISTDSGHTGIGESCAWEPTFYGETLETVELIIKNYLTPILIDRIHAISVPFFQKLIVPLQNVPAQKRVSILLCMTSWGRFSIFRSAPCLVDDIETKSPLQVSSGLIPKKQWYAMQKYPSQKA